MHGKLEVIAGFASFSIPLLWEDSVWFSALQVDAVTKSKGELMAERRDPNLQEEDGVILRALVRVDEGTLLQLKVMETLEWYLGKSSSIPSKKAGRVKRLRRCRKMPLR